MGRFSMANMIVSLALILPGLAVPVDDRTILTVLAGGSCSGSQP